MNQLTFTDPAHILEHGITEDIPSLVALAVDTTAHLRSQGIEQWDEVYPDETVIARDVAASTLYVLREAGRIIGCMTVDDRHDPLWEGMAWSAEGAPAAVVHRVMVHPSRQGRGLSKQLMVCAEALARDKGCRSIHLDCFPQNPAAMALYEYLGYRRTGTAMMRKGPFVCFEKLL